MKVMQINAVYGVGSTGVIVEDIHNLALENGMDSHVVYSSTNKKQDGIVNGYAVKGNLEKKIHALLCRINGRQAYFSHIATSKLISHIKKVKPDVVHLHNLHSNYINLNMLLSYLGKSEIPTVISLHDCWYFTGGCFHYTSAGCDKWTKECGSCPKKKKDTPAYLFDMSHKILKDRIKYLGKIKNLTLVGASEWMTSEAKQSRIPAKSFATVNNGIDLGFFVPTGSELRKELGIEDKFVVLAVANKWMLPVNAETFKTVTEGLDEETVMLLVGCSEEQKKNLPANVVPIDYIKDRNILRCVYSLADVFANCTREDTLATVNIEALGCGTPVVAYRNTGNPETIGEGCGFSVETGNAKEMLEKIREIKKNGKAVYSQRCREFVTEKFSKANYNKYIEIYKSVCK